MDDSVNTINIPQHTVSDFRQSLIDAISHFSGPTKDSSEATQHLASALTRMQDADSVTPQKRADQLTVQVLADIVKRWVDLQHQEPVPSNCGEVVDDIFVKTLPCAMGENLQRLVVEVMIAEKPLNEAQRRAMSTSMFGSFYLLEDGEQTAHQ